MNIGLVKPLTFRAYRSLFSAQLFSDLGNWLDFVALQVIVAYQWGLDETAIAALIFVLGVPWVIIGPFASVFVDRCNKKFFMIVCLLLRIILVGGLFIAPNLPILLILVFLKGTVAAIYDPARQSMIRFTIPEEYLPQAVTLSQLSNNTMKILGPALGGGIIAVFGAKSPFLFEGVGFFLAVTLLLKLPNIKEHVLNTDSINKESIKKNDYWKELIEGIKHIVYTPKLQTAVVLSSIGFFLIFLYDGLLVFIAQNLGFSQGNFGLLISAVGLGSVIGSILLGNWTGWKSKPLQIMSVAFLISGFFIIVMGLGDMGVVTLPLIGWCLGAFILGLMGSGESVPYSYLLQSETPKHMMGRVSAVATAFQTISMLIAPAIGSLFSKLIGASLILLAAGGATWLMGVIILLFIVKRINHSKKIKGEFNI